MKAPFEFLIAGRPLKGGFTGAQGRSAQKDRGNQFAHSEASQDEPPPDSPKR
jgi:hypothetical protein